MSEICPLSGALPWAETPGETSGSDQLLGKINNIKQWPIGNFFTSVLIFGLTLKGIPLIGEATNMS